MNQLGNWWINESKYKENSHGFKLCRQNIAKGSKLLLIKILRFYPVWGF